MMMMGANEDRKENETDSDSRQDSKVLKEFTGSMG